METTTHHSQSSQASHSTPTPTPVDTSTLQQKLDAAHQRLDAAQQKLDTIQTRIDTVLKAAWAKLRARQQPASHTPAVAVMPEHPLYLFA